MTEAESPAPTTGRRSDRMRSLVLAALAILSPLALNLYLPALPDIGAWFGVDIQRIELSVGLFLIGLGAGQLIGAPVSDRYGRRPSTMLGLAFFAAPTIFILPSQSADQFVLFRCAQGIGLGIATVNIAAVIADLADTQGAARALTLIQVAQAAGHIATPVAGAALVVVFDWRSAFVILLLYCCVLAVALWIHLPETVSRIEGRGRTVPRQAMRGYLRVLSRPRALAYAICLSFAAGGSFVYLTDSAFLYLEWFGLGPTRFGLLLALNTVAFGVGTAFNMRLLRRRRADRIVPLACGGQCLSALLLLAHVGLMEPSLPVVVVLLMPTTGVLGLIAGNAGACFLAYFPGLRATASAIVGSLPYLVGGVVGSGLSMVHGGTPVATAAGIAGCAVVAVVASRVARPVETSADHPRLGGNR